MTSKTRVLFAVPVLDRGGPDRVLFELIQHLDRERFDVSLMVARRGGHYFDLLRQDVSATSLHASDEKAARYPVVRALKHIRHTKPDVVFSTLRMNLTLGLVPRVLRRATRLILRPASPVSADFAALMQTSLIKHRVARRLTLAALRGADAVVCQSWAMKRDVQGLIGDSQSARLHVLENPIDVTEVERLAARPHVDLRGRPALVSVGRLVPLKGYDVLLGAIRALRDEFPALHLTIIGDGPEGKALESMRRDLALQDHVTLLGYSTTPLAYVKRADLFVLASRYDAFANSALEALACGTPVVLTDCPGANAELVRDAENGRLASGTSVEPVVSAIRQAISELPLYDRDEIRSDCARRFGTTRIVRRFEDLLTTIARQPCET